MCMKTWWFPQHSRKEEVMPVITIQMWEGRSVEQKRELVKAITKAMVDIGKTRQEAVQVIIHDVPKNNWGTGGMLASEKTL